MVSGDNNTNTLWANFEFNSWYAILFSFLFWCLSYACTALIFRSKTPEYWSRFITLVHGVLSAFHGVNHCFSNEWSFSNPNAPTTDSQAFLLVMSLGYFMQDLLWCLYYQTESRLMVSHHIYSCISLYRILMKGTTGGQTACALGTMEITNPLLQARWFIRFEGLRNSILFAVTELIFMVLFGFVRLFLGTALTIIIVLESENTWEYRLMTVVIYALSWMFMVNIMQYFYYKYMKGNLDETLRHTPNSS